MYPSKANSLNMDCARAPCATADARVQPLNGPLGDIAEALDRVGSLGGSLRDAADRLVNLIDPVLKPAVPPDNKPCAVPEPTRSPLARALHSRADDLYLVICCLNDAAERVQLHS